MGYTDDLHSLSHTKWNCKYQIVFVPKYRRIVGGCKKISIPIFHMEHKYASLLL